MRSRLSLTLLPIAAILGILTLYSWQRGGSHNFPFHNLTSHDPVGEDPTWFIWTSTAAHLQTRREIIRSTWQTLYRNVSFEAKFVIGTPKEEWLPIIRQENDTYGDIIMLEGHADDKEFATTLKPFEVLKYCKDQAAITGKNWTFVSKIDDDSFLDARAFRNEFLLPHQHDQRKIISRVVQYSRPHPFPGGQFYTLTWDLVELVAHLYETTNRDLVHLMDDVKGTGKTKRAKSLMKRHEDFMMADLLIEANEPFEYVELTLERAFDIIVQGNVTKKSINPHRLKSDEQYLTVAAMYDENGYRGPEKDGVNLEDKLREITPT